MEELERKIKAHLEARGWDHLRPVDLAKSIMIEGAELLELFQWENLSLEEVKNNPKKMEAIKKELADVLMYAFDMAVTLGISTREILETKLAYIDQKYPAELMRKGTQGTQDDVEYWRIKNEYRKKD